MKNKSKKINLPKGADKVFDGIRWNVYQWDQVQFDGSTKRFETLSRNDSVTVIPVIDNKILIIEEEQPNWKNPEHALIGGNLEKGESILSGAKRELEEETGYVFKDFFHVESFEPVLGIDWHIHIVIAKNLEYKTTPTPDAGERIKPMEIDFDDLISKVRRRDFFYKPTFIDEFIIKDEIETLRKIINNPKEFLIDF